MHPKSMTKSDIGGKGHMQTVTSPPGKIMYKFLIVFYLFLVSAAAAELWLTFQW